jgi:hypothetical protein
MARLPHLEPEPIRAQDVQGLRYFHQLWPLLERLHDVGCQRDKAGNRELFMDQYCGLVLLFLFNPCVRSLRALQQASQLKNVQRKLGRGRASLGSLSEATDVFDPARLRQMIDELAAEVQPTLRTYETVCLYFQGWASEEELLAHLQKLKPCPESSRSRSVAPSPFTLR